MDPQRHIPASAGWEAWIPRLVRALVFITLGLIPLGILRLGFLPPDEALSHAAKAISGKSWQEILVMPKELTIDHQRGWHALLEAVFRTFHPTADTLVAAGAVAMFLLFSFSFFACRSRPEAVALMMVLSAVTIPGFVSRLMLGRPSLAAAASLVLLLSLWAPANRIGRLRPAFTVFLFASAVWIQGDYLLYLLPVAAFFTAGRIRQGLALTGCWVAGCALAAWLSGEPLAFWGQQARQIALSYNSSLPIRLLARDARPSGGDVSFLLTLAILLLFQKQLTGRWEKSRFLDPCFLLGVFGWILGFRAARFWLDWGLPAMMIWMAARIHTGLVWKSGYASWGRLAFAGLLCLALFLCFTGDLEERWTGNIAEPLLGREDKSLAEWLPGSGGIIYSIEPGVFYRTFYKNPDAPWRYVLGFEAGFMLPEDRSVLFDIQMRTLYDSFDVWARKMRAEDRLMIRGSSSAKPKIPLLEWHFAPDYRIWIGRVRRTRLPSLPAP